MSKNISRKGRATRRRSLRHLSVRGVLRREPNLQKIAGTMAALALADAERAAQIEDQQKRGQS
ncbi:hypothetical protein [Rathayibacter sp. AY1A3]|uniref:hypothetical protein n=1 Tax=Rathayibacter sp. AY1A3 TaxID=2080521 RepID=UPI0011AFD4F4|nr:hypothetical protein [Rathayibacter sp. AY1A3]